MKKLVEQLDKNAFLIGISLIIITPLLLFLLSFLMPINSGVMLFIEGSIFFIATLFILHANHKRSENNEKIIKHRKVK